MRYLVIVVAALLAAVAVAQPTPPADFQWAVPASWVLSTASLAFVVYTATAFLKARLGFGGDVTRLVSFALGIGLALLAGIDLPWLGRLFDGTFGEALAFGITASIAASGWFDGTRQLAKATS
jgi:hypothetical protein